MNAILASKRTTHPLQLPEFLSPQANTSHFPTPVHKEKVTDIGNYGNYITNGTLNANVALEITPNH